MWNDLSHGFSVLADALAFLSRSWGFWVCAGSVAGLAAVYAWWRKRLALWAFVLAFLSLLAVVGLACRQAVCQKAFLWIHEPDVQALSGKYEVEPSPRERRFFRPPEVGFPDLQKSVFPTSESRYFRLLENLLFFQLFC